MPLYDRELGISKVRHVVSVNFAKVVEQSRVSNRVNRSSLLEILLQKRARMRIRSTATTINVKRLCITIHASRERRFTAGARERDPPLKLGGVEDYVSGNTRFDFPRYKSSLVARGTPPTTLSNVNYPHPINICIQ